MDLRVKKICKERGMNLKGLADKLGMTAESLSRIINGNPRIDTLEKIADTLGVPLVSLFTVNCPNCGIKIDVAGTTPAKPAPSNSTVQTSKQGASLFDYIGKCTDTIGGIGLSKHLRAYSGDDVLVNQVDNQFYDGFMKYLQTAKKTVHGSIITEMYRKRLKSCFDEILALLPSE